MLRNIQRFFDTKISSSASVTSQAATDSSLQLATAALLIEITKADQNIKSEERSMVTSAVQRTFNLTPEETSELIAMAEEEVKGGRFPLPVHPPHRQRVPLREEEACRGAALACSLCRC